MQVILNVVEHISR